MNEIAQILEQKEKTLWDGKPKYAPYMISVVLWAVIIGLFAGIWVASLITPLGGFFLGLLIGVIVLAVGQIMYNVTHYALTKERVIYQSGIFGRSFKSINYDDIKNASVQRGLFNWIFGTGTIRVFTGEMESGGKNSQMRPKYDNFLYITNAYDVLRRLQEHLSDREESLYGGENVVQRVKVIK